MNSLTYRLKKLLLSLLGSFLYLLLYPFKNFIKIRQEYLIKKYIKNKKSISDLQAHTLLANLAWREYKQGIEEQAKKYANDLLVLNNRIEENWNSGNAVHHSHTIIGLVNFNKGNTKSAINHLMKSSRVSGSPQLNTIGPSFTLAQKLYIKGEHNAVIKYLQNCDKFWNQNNGQIGKWVMDIKNGKEPEEWIKES